MKPIFCGLLLLCPYLNIIFAQSISVSGSVFNAADQTTLPGATVTAIPSGISTFTNNYGRFHLKKLSTGDTAITISNIGFAATSITIKHNDILTIFLQPQPGLLNETVVMAYGTTNKRFNTGNISKLAATAIEKQPVSNPLLTLSGRIPGLVVTQTTGLNGAAVKVQLRGLNSLVQGSEPLFIIDGIPFAPNNNAINQFSASVNPPNADGGFSPFSMLDPAAIESIEVLKDADATAIYGSRGANGVILITTKKAKEGKTKLSVTFSSGTAVVKDNITMLNTAEYISMRKEAFKNDNITPTISNAPDLLLWDTTRFTNFRNYLIGGTAKNTNIQLNLQGGNANTRFIIAGGFRKETTVFPGELGMTQANTRFNLNHSSPNKKTILQLATWFSVGQNKGSSADLTSFSTLPPNTPALFMPDGRIKWEEAGVAFANPMAALLNTHTINTQNLNSSVQLTQQLYKTLVFRLNAGINQVTGVEKNKYPILSQNPANLPRATFRLGNNKYISWSVEPQLEWSHTWKGNKLTLLTGTAWQDITNESNTITANGISNDALIESLAAATQLQALNGFNQYRYAAWFGRVNYNIKNTYLINLSGRRDASSRFGPENRLASFGAIGAAWIFSNNSWINKKMTWLSFGKLRASYGTTGNDQIGNYKYLDAWNTNLNTYAGGAGLTPAQLFNPDYGWEINRKLEIALELAFLKDKHSITIAAFRNRSNNQLVNYALPIQTGFSGITTNLPALVQNQGIEIEIRSTLIKSKKINWTIDANLTLPQNKLLRFPGLEKSAYANRYLIGEPLNVLYSIHSLGVDPTTGIYVFEDLNKDGIINAQDIKNNGSLDPKFYGGITNTITWSNWEASFLLDYREQLGRNFLHSNTGVPGTMRNQPTQVLNRWRSLGDIMPYGQFTQNTASAAFRAANTLALSNTDGRFENASFMRLRNLAVAYNIPNDLCKKWKLQQAKLTLQAQNLFTITPYTSGDPESQNAYALPPLRTMMATLQLTF